MLAEQVNRDVELVACTEHAYRALSNQQQENIPRAAVSFDATTAVVFLNLSELKSAEQVIEALAHEGAHVKLGHNRHTQEFEREKERLLEEARRHYVDPPQLT